MTTSSEVLAGWSRSAFTASGETRDLYRRGSGPGVIVIHEIPGIEPDLVAFADELVAAGFTVILPHLFGTPGAGFSFSNIWGDVSRFCVRREFSVFARGRTSPIAGWLRALARDVHADLGGPGVGVIGMCFTGGFALAMMVDAPVVAPILAEPSLPAAVGLPRTAQARGADLGLDPADLDAVKASGCEVLGLRYRTDGATGTRFDTLRRELGDRFLAVEFEAKGHSVLTAHRREYGVEQVQSFLRAKLHTVGDAPERARDASLEAELVSHLGDGFEARITHDPDLVVLFVERGLTVAGVARAEQISKELVGVSAEIVRVTPATAFPG
jgi:dienelactone hydrolase